MSSTYTSSLQIQQIGNGEQSGTWGTTTNTNMALVDQAVAGAVTITMSNANRTLTQTNGASDEARNMVLEVVGSNSGVYQIIVPYGTGGAGTGSKMYLVYNNTTGGYAITIGYSGGSTVSIPNGYIATVFGDGTNFFSANTTSAGAFNVNGTLTASGIADVGNLSVSGTATFSGSTTALTQSPGDNSTKVATTAFVTAATSGLGTMAQQNANNVAITGGTINGVTGTNSGMTVGTATNATNVTGTIGSAVTATTQTSTDNSTKVATTAFVQSAATAAAQAAYPVGSIYMNASNSTTPATLLGFGSWSALGAGQMLLGAGTNSGNTFTAGSSGGTYAPTMPSHTHTATVTDPGHTHTNNAIYQNSYPSIPGGGFNAPADLGPATINPAVTGITVVNSSTSSGDQTLGNLPPYLVVYMWVRTA